MHINSCGISRFSLGEITHRPRILRPMGRVDYQLLLVTEGNLEVETNERKIHLSSGEAILFYPNQIQDYTYYLTADQPNATHYFVHFSGNEVKNILDKLNITRAKIIFKPSVDVEYIFQNMIKEYNRKAELSAIGYLLRLLSGIATVSEYRNDSVNLILKEAGYISTHFRETIDFDECASRCNLSRSRFTHLFKQKVGISPSGYQKNLRIEQAIEMLMFSTQSVGEIAEALGFLDARYFSRLFKKETGKLPTEYRKLK